VPFVLAFVLSVVESRSPAPHRPVRSPSAALGPHRLRGSSPSSSRARARCPGEIPAANGAPQLLDVVAPPLAVAAPPLAAGTPPLAARARSWPLDREARARIVLTSGQTGQRPVNRHPAPALDPNRRIFDPMDQIHPFSVPAHFYKENPEFFQNYNPVLPP
jgi:hypothetical protein